MRLHRLRRAELPTSTVELARYLLGTFVVSDIDFDGAPGGADSVAGVSDECGTKNVPSGRTIVRIVETEAYLVGDSASHAFRGQTPRNASMFERRGVAYVYFIYGTSFCLNVSSETLGVGAAVLIRAGEPVAGLATMRARRGDVVDRDLCRGPGRLARSLGVTRDHDRVDLCAPGALRLAGAAGNPPAIVATRRIGLTREIERPLRFVVRGSPFASGSRTANLGSLASLSTSPESSGSDGAGGER